MWQSKQNAACFYQLSGFDETSAGVWTQGVECSE